MTEVIAVFAVKPTSVGSGTIFGILKVNLTGIRTQTSRVKPGTNLVRPVISIG